MGFFSSKSKSIYEMSDRELIKFIEHPPFGTSIAGMAKATQEAVSRGLTNPRTGKPYGTTNH